MSQISTRLVHHEYQAPAGFEAIGVPVHRASTIIFPNVAALRDRDWRHRTGYTYGLHGTPTTFTLEQRMATLEGGQFCVLVPSGLAAISLVDLALLKADDEVLIPDNAYDPNKVLARNELAGWGVTHRLYNPMDAADLASKVSAKTRLVWLEAAGSVTLEFPDLRALVAAVRAQNKNAVIALDNTWGAGIAFAPFDFGVDISVQAMTKYPSGGGDVLMGSVVLNDEALRDQVLLSHMRLGYGIGANDAELVLRSLPSIAMRYAAQDAATRALATWLQTQPQFEVVLHPALPHSPGHAAWARDCTGAACLVSVVFKPQYSWASIDKFCDSLKLFKLGYSWAGPMSLCAPFNVPTLRNTPWPHSPGLVRLCVGFEAVEDLVADIERALKGLSF